MKHNFREVNFVQPTDFVGTGFKDSLLKIILENSSPYLILSNDQVKLTKNVFLPICIKAMQKTRAYAFYLNLGQEKAIKNKRLQKGVYLSNIEKPEGLCSNLGDLEMCLYSRLNLEKTFKELMFNSANDLIKAWMKIIPFRHQGLSFDQPVTSKLPSS